MKTYVIVEVFNGHQIIKQWKCGDLVHYVNRLGSRVSDYRTLVASSKNDVPFKRTLSSSIRGASEPREELVPVAPDQKRLRAKKKVTSQDDQHEHHHHYYFWGGGRRGGVPTWQQAGRPQISQLTYRDLRQVRRTLEVFETNC